MSAFWHWFIVLITLAMLGGCLWLLFVNARGTPGAPDTGHVWDDDLREYNNPLPRWWLNLFVITVVFALGYLVVYPGLGRWGGTFGWTQVAEMEQNLAEVRARRETLYAAFKDKDIAALSRDDRARALGHEVFLSNCAGCHGADARGALGFPNLTDQDWLYGGAPEQIVASITSGRRGVMPFFTGSIPPENFEPLIETVRRWSDPKLPAAVREHGMKQFSVTCAACHGPEGRGNPMLGAPNLTDDVWLYGGTAERIRETVLYGRKGNMPSHEPILSADDIRVVAAYVYGLAQPQKVAQQ